MNDWGCHENSCITVLFYYYLYFNTVFLNVYVLLSFYIADQVYGDQDMHDVVRKQCMDYLVSQFKNK